MLLPCARDLSDTQWAILDLLIPEPPCRKDGRGRPWKDRRTVLNGILWVREAFIDGSFAPAKKGAPRLAKQSAAKAPKSWPWWIGTACP
jgi:transposase